MSSLSVYGKPSNEIILCVDNWEGLTNTNGTGSYSEIVKKVFEPEYKVIIKLSPWARAQGEFKDKKCDGLIAESKIDDSMLKPRIVLDALPLHAYFIKGKLVFEGEKTLKTKKLAWFRGYNYNRLLNYKVNFSEFGDIKSGFKMLEAGRFDVMIDYAYTFKDECKTSGANCSKIDGAFSGIIEKAYVVVHNNELGSKLIKLWDSKMEVLIKSGEAQKIFVKYGQTYNGP